MYVYLVRHGIAEESAASGADADRELTDEGRERLADIFKRAAKAEVQPDLILTSPYKRAMETAAIAAKLLGYKDAPKKTQALVPHGSPQRVWEELGSHRGAQSMLLAGHEPLLSQTLSYMLSSPAMEVDFKKGAIVALEFGSLRGEPRGILKWMLTAGLCR